MISDMKIGPMANKILLLLVAIFVTQTVSAQFLVEQLDTTNASQKGLWAVYSKTDHLQISGYFNRSSRLHSQKVLKTSVVAIFPPVPTTGL